MFREIRCLLVFYVDAFSFAVCRFLSHFTSCDVILNWIVSFEPFNHTGQQLSYPGLSDQAPPQCLCGKISNTGRKVERQFLYYQAIIDSQ